MSGRPKKGLDYAPWSVGIFDGDRKIDALLDTHGWKGFGTYFYLCQKAYQENGYFLEWGFADCPTTARRLGGGIGAKTVEEIVSFCLRVGLFDKNIFYGMLRDEVGVLTSRGIQRRYWSVISSTRRVKEAYKEIWLLKSEECEGLVKVSLFQNSQGANNHLQPTNDDMQPTNDPKRKQNKTEENKTEEKHVRGADEPHSEGCFFPADEKLDRAFRGYLDYMKEKGKPISNSRIEYVKKQLYSLSGESGDMIRILEQSIRKGWNDLYPLGKQREDTVAKDTFHNFVERKYDYGALEQKLRKN